MSCLPARNVTVYRGNKNSQRMKIDVDGSKMSETWKVSPNITLQETMNLLTGIENLSAIRVTIPMSSEPYKFTIWSQERGFINNQFDFLPNSPLYVEMEKIRQGHAYASEKVGDYVFIAVFPE